MSLVFLRPLGSDFLATRIIEIDDGKVTDYPGTLAEYEDFKRRRARGR